MQFVRNILYSLKKYGYLLNQLVSRDFKVKYKRSILGVAWSLLYPLLTTGVMALVFSNIFRFTQPGVSFMAYLMTGLTYFNYFSEASNLSMSSVVANFSLINKVYIPKYIFPLSKCLFVGINFLLTLIPLYAVLLLTGTGVNWHHLLLPYSFFCLFLFTLGMSFLLSTIAVFMRDMFYIYGIVLTLWTYLTPIMYDLQILADKPVFQQILKINPMYQFINFGRMIMLYNLTPSRDSWIACFVSGAVVLLLGVFVFRKNQDKFIYYI
ncbi:MAG: ABC transporter permease [Oscillospiraceae bacterium]|nr:ABC transporter permease [Oscillospiraceae bacterium]MBQ6403220.1 ABC transporter permease [Oscillospiraceae bacterium]